MKTTLTDSLPTTASAAPKVHVFESAGLGKAPFRFVRHEVRKYCAGPGCPVQPGYACEYCGASIFDVYFVRGTGPGAKEFGVGCDCVRKTGDAGLRKPVDEIVRAANRAKAASKAANVRELLTAFLANPENRAKLAGLPHPTEWRAARGETALDHAEWYARNAGATGREWLARSLGILAPKRARARKGA